MFALVDCNNFYASCERAFQPKLVGKPIIVLSNNDGCVVARSNEAKELGIKMGEPLFKIRNLVERENVRVFSSNYALYADMSNRVMQTLQRFSPDVEIYSIDESFVNLWQSPNTRNNHARLMRDTVLQWTRIPVTVGIGSTKTLAKIANRIAKKTKSMRGVFDLSQHTNPDALLEKVPVGDIWGIGRRWTELLCKHNIFTALDLKNANDKWVRQKMTVVGQRTVWELRGISCIDLETAPRKKQQIIVSRSFGASVRSLAEMQEATASYASRAVEKLRKQDGYCPAMSVWLTTNYFLDAEEQYSNQAIVRLPVPSNYTPDFVRGASRGIEQIWKDGFKYKKSGVMLLDITSSEGIQQNLFTGHDDVRRQSIMKAMDSVNGRYGRGTLELAALGAEKTAPQQWKMRRENLSPEYTTKWSDVPRIG
jgi:DNA polymerase V